MKSKRKDGSRDTVFDGEEASEKESSSCFRGKRTAEERREEGISIVRWIYHPDGRDSQRPVKRNNPKQAAIARPSIPSSGLEQKICFFLFLSISRDHTNPSNETGEVWNGEIVALLSAAEQTEQQSGWCNAAGPLSSIVLLRSFYYSNLCLYLLSRIWIRWRPRSFSPPICHLFTLSLSLSLSPLSLRSPCSEWEWIHSMLLRLLHLHFYCFNWYIYNKANGITK